MLKKIGFVTAGAAAGLMMMSGMASAQGEPGDYAASDGNGNGNVGQVGLVNLNNTDVLHNVNAVVGVCDNNVNVLGVQVIVHEVAEQLPIDLDLLNPSGSSEDEDTSTNADSCASGGIIDGGTAQQTGNG
jgi:hypothetical protein